MTGSDTDQAVRASSAPTPKSLDADDLTAEHRAGLEELLFRLADDEFVHAERLTEWQIYAPTLESDLALANIAQDEFGHARLWFDLLEELGYTEPELIWERPPGEWTHATLVERPFETGDWADAVLRGYLYDVAERLRLEALVDTSYAPLADRVGKALSEETFHREHAENWLERLAANPQSRERLQGTLETLFPAALTLFVPGPREEAVIAGGFRTESLSSLRETWLETTVPFLESLDLAVPEPSPEARPDTHGRDGAHTDAWVDLHAEFTATYHEIGVEDPTRLRGGDDA